MESRKVGGSAFSHRLGQPTAPVQGLPQLTLALLEEGNGKETPAFRAWIHVPYARPGALQTFSHVSLQPPHKARHYYFCLISTEGRMDQRG